MGVFILIFHNNFQMEIQKHLIYLEVNYSTNSATWNADKKKKKKKRESLQAKWSHKIP